VSPQLLAEKEPEFNVSPGFGWALRMQILFGGMTTIHAFQIARFRRLS
jgi:hypothetical protein